MAHRALPESRMFALLLATCTALGACGGGDPEPEDLQLAQAESQEQWARPLGATLAAAAETSAGTSSSTASGGSRWSDRATWGGTLPGNGTEVVIPAGKTIVLDGATPALAGLRIEGTLRIEGAIQDDGLAGGDHDLAAVAGQRAAPGRTVAPAQAAARGRRSGRAFRRRREGGGERPRP